MRYRWAPFRKLGSQKRDLRRPQTVTPLGDSVFPFPRRWWCKNGHGTQRCILGGEVLLAWGASILRMDS